VAPSWTTSYRLRHNTATAAAVCGFGTIQVLYVFAFKSWFINGNACSAGPFQRTEMAGWHSAGFFTPNLLVKRGADSSFIQLGNNTLQYCLFFAGKNLCSFCVKLERTSASYLWPRVNWH